tara:strand:+ start:922 stop:1128 length:207 start_codon:yes stop_codon:yes gene_type:complete
MKTLKDIKDNEWEERKDLQTVVDWILNNAPKDIFDSNHMKDPENWIWYKNSRCKYKNRYERWRFCIIR